MYARGVKDKKKFAVKNTKTKLQGVWKYWKSVLEYFAFDDIF